MKLVHAAAWLLEEITLRAIRAGRGRSTATSAYRFGYHAVRRADWPHAISFGRIAVASDPGWAYGYILLGYACLKAGRHMEAREALTRGLHVAPGDPRLLTYLGDMHLNASEYDAADVAYRGALASDPNNTDARRGLGLALMNRGRLEEAVAVLEPTRDSEPSVPRVLEALADAYVRLRRPELAESVARRLVQRHPESASGYYWRGLSLAMMERWGEAKVAAQRALELEPDNAQFDDLLRATEVGLSGHARWQG